MQCALLSALFIVAHAKCPWGGEAKKYGKVEGNNSGAAVAESILANAKIEEEVGPCTCGIKPSLIEIQELEGGGLAAGYLLGQIPWVGGSYFQLNTIYSGCGAVDDVSDDLNPKDLGGAIASETCATHSESIEIEGYKCTRCHISSTHVPHVGKFAYWTIGCDCNGNMCSEEMLKSIMKSNGVVPNLATSVVATDAGVRPLALVLIPLVSVASMLFCKGSVVSPDSTACYRCLPTGLSHSSKHTVDVYECDREKHVGQS